MIRNFSKCGGNLERINFLKELSSSDYSLDDLKSLCNVMSFPVKEGISKVDLLSSMMEELEQRMKDEGMGIHKVSQRLNAMDTDENQPEDGTVDSDVKSVVDALFIQEEF